MCEAVNSVDILDRIEMTTLVQKTSAIVYPAVCSVTASVPFRRPAALGLLLRFQRPYGIPVPPETSLKNAADYAAQASSGPLQESRPSALGSRAHSLGFALCDPSKIGKFNKWRQDHVPEQSYPHRIPRQ